MAKLIYVDEAGNKLYKKYIKTRDTWQYYGKNREGKIVKPSAFNTLAKRAGLIIGKVRKSGIQRVRLG